MVFADHANGAGLRALFSHLLDKANFGTDGQPVKGVIENAVAVKIDLAAISCFDEAAILLGEEFRHMAMIPLFMRLDLTARFANGVLDLTLRRVESILNRHRVVFVLGRVAMSLRHKDVRVRGHSDADIDLE